VNRTRILVALLVLVVLVQLFPAKSALIKMIWVSGGGILVAAWALTRYFAQRRKKSVEAAQSANDDREYQQYRQELDIIRGKYDPLRDLDDPTSITAECRDELNALHERHRAMLERKFGTR